MLKLKKLKNYLKKNIGKKIVLCHGVFDVIHVGHLNYLEKAKSYGDILIVSITSKKFVNKGIGRPLYSDSERKKFLDKISFVDFVHINDSYTAVSLIKLIKPDFYCKGKEYSNFNNDLTNNIKKEIIEVKKNKGIFKIIDTKAFSSSSIINNYFKAYDKEQKYILSLAKKKLNNTKIYEIKEKLKKLSVLVFGESIIDEYVFCETIGKSGKDPMLVTKKLNSKKYLGGVLSVANILASFVKSVKVITYLGNTNTQLSFIKKNLLKNVKIKFINKKDSPTILKKRYVDNYFKNKIFGAYELNNNFLNSLEEKKILNILNKISKQDILCVMDYGHGLFTNKICSKLNKIKNNKSLNVQFNSFNSNFQKISKFKNFNLACFNQKELFLENKEYQNNDEIETLAKHLLKKQKFKKMIISLGKEGSKLFDKRKNKSVYCPGFTKKADDRIGAGDSLFAMLTILNKLNLDPYIQLLISNYLAFLSLEKNGPMQKIDSNNFFKYFEHFIK